MHSLSADNRHIGRYIVQSADYRIYADYLQYRIGRISVSANFPNLDIVCTLGHPSAEQLLELRHVHLQVRRIRLPFHKSARDWQCQCSKDVLRITAITQEPRQGTSQVRIRTWERNLRYAV